MRVVDAAEYAEPRDALAQDWPKFMRRVLPEARWLPLPNLGNEIIYYNQWWDLNGFLITGGNNLFEKPERDRTETALIGYSLENNLPVYGVCRGFQIMAHYFGHKITSCRPGGHAGTRHKVHLLNDPCKCHEGELVVNSYHDNCARHVDEYTGPLIPFAVDDEDRVEGFRHVERKLMAVMWHPERESPLFDFDVNLVQDFFRE